VSDARQIKYELDLDTVDGAGLEVLDLEVREALSDGWTAVVRAASAEFFDGSALLGKDGSLTIAIDDELRRFGGVIVRCTLEKVPSGANLLEVELRSRLALLAFGCDNRLFTDTDCKTIAEKILKDLGFAADQQEWNIVDPPKRPHVLQRNESDLAFIQRLLAREGIGYAVHNGESKEKVVFFDDSSKLPLIDGVSALNDRPQAGVGLDVVFDVRERARVSSDAVMMRDYDPALPAANLDVHAPPSGGGTREIYLHPGDYNKVPIGKRFAQRALEGAAASGRVLSGRSNCPRLEPGRRFSIEGHPREALNAEYLVTELVHRGNVTETPPDTAEGTEATETPAATESRQVAYDNHFTALPSKTQFRPRQLEPLRRGPEVGFATVPSGEEIHVDDFGRAKVRFPWDRSGKMDDTSSNWMRVGQLQLGGSMILPRKDFEVIVDYELAEADRPFVSGHLYNGKKPPPYALPQSATTSSLQTATTHGGPGANELRFDDTAGKEQIFLNASKDLTISVENDATFTVGKNETSKIGVNSELSVGTDHVARVISNRKLNVGASQNVNVGGDLTETVGSTSDVTVGAVRHVQVGGDHTENTKGNVTRKVGALQCVTGLKAFSRNVHGDSKVTAGAAWLEVVGRSRASDVSGSRTETVGALKLIKAKQVSVSCTGNLVVNAAANTVTCEGSRTDAAEAALAISAGGGISIKAKNITIEAKDKLVMMLGGCMFQLEKGGKVVVKAASVDIKGAKSLGQIKHASN
jgi:type VI secretion system secreted protein VgrG